MYLPGRITRILRIKGEIKKMESMKGSLCVKDSYRPIGGTKQMFETNRYFKFSDVCGFYFFWGEGG